MRFSERLGSLNRHGDMSNTNQNQKLFIGLVEVLVASKISGRPASITGYLYGGWDKFNGDIKENTTKALKDEDKDEGVQANV